MVTNMNTNQTKHEFWHLFHDYIKYSTILSNTVFKGFSSLTCLFTSHSSISLNEINNSMTIRNRRSKWPLVHLIERAGFFSCCSIVGSWKLAAENKKYVVINLRDLAFLPGFFHWTLSQIPEKRTKLSTTIF